MADLDELMRVPGALAAFEMNARGELEESRIAAPERFDERTLDLLGHMCVANLAIATMQARGWEASEGGGGFYPVEGFALLGMDWSVVTNGRQAVVVPSEGAGHARLFELLNGGGGS